MSAGAVFKRDKNGKIEWVAQMGDRVTGKGVGVNYISVDEDASQVLVRGTSRPTQSSILAIPREPILK